MLLKILIYEVWMISLILLWFKKERISQSVETQYRFLLSYFLISTIVVLIFVGNFLISDTYLANVITELIGIAITVFIIDRIYNFINSRNEILYRNLALKTCKMPIFTYCTHWLAIFESNNNKRQIEMSKFATIEDFFNSDIFYQQVCEFNFNDKIAPDKNYAEYYNERFSGISEKFQGIISKYASKLSVKDIQLLEHFGGNAYFFTVFSLMQFMGTVKFTHKRADEPEQIRIPFNNYFREISKENFQKHFKKLAALINEYNQVVESENDKWTIDTLNKLGTIQSANNDSLTNW